MGTLNLDAIEAAWQESPALISNVVPDLVAEVRRLRAERDGLRSVARTHVFDPDNYISPLRPQIRALRDAILAESERTTRAPTDLADHLRTAVARLEHLRDRPTTGGYEKARLNGKIDGVKLAAAYLEEGERIFPGAVSSS